MSDILPSKSNTVRVERVATTSDEASKTNRSHAATSDCDAERIELIEYRSGDCTRSNGDNVRTLVIDDLLHVTYQHDVRKYKIQQSNKGAR